MDEAQAAGMAEAVVGFFFASFGAILLLRFAVRVFMESLR